jgi:hypothetical protein
LQKISRTGGRLILDQNGGTIALPDSSSTNEIQTLSISSGKGRISLSNGGNVILDDSSSTNELQTLRLSNDTLFISNKNYVILSSLLSGRTETTYTDTIEMHSGLASGSISSSSTTSKIFRCDSLNLDQLGREIKIDFGISTLSFGSISKFSIKIFGPDGKQIDNVAFTLDQAVGNSSSPVYGFARSYSLSSTLDVDLSNTTPGGVNFGNFISSSFIPKKSGKHFLQITFELKGSSSSSAFINYGSLNPIWHYTKSKSIYIKGSSNANGPNNSLIYTIKEF